jgi:phospholipid/cholesterol/gamma-HCH transport system substrate-binding protein
MAGRAWRTYASAIAWIAVFASLSTVAGIYILSHQRLRLPGQDRYVVRIGFAASTALTPGFGQPVTVSGVKVGAVDDVALSQGTAIVTARIDPHRLPHVYADARAALVPATPTKDMQVDLDPGRARAGELGARVVAISRTDIPVDADELTAALDAETRDYLTTLIRGAGIGLHRRGPDLKALFKTLRPTLRQVRLINTELAGRERDVARLVHHLTQLSGAVADEAPRLRGLVRDSSRTLRASARNDRALGSGLSLLPPTLTAARRTLASGRALVDELRPTLTALTPATRKTPRALDATQPVLDASIPLVRDQLRPLVRRLQPLAGHLRPSIRRLTSVTPALTRAFASLRYFTNELVHTPSAPTATDRGYLFWMAWLAHNAASVLSTRDADGSIVRGLQLLSCESLSPPKAAADVVKLLSTLAGTACPKDGS